MHQRNRRDRAGLGYLLLVGLIIANSLALGYIVLIWSQDAAAVAIAPLPTAQVVGLLLPPEVAVVPVGAHLPTPVPTATQPPALTTAVPLPPSSPLPSPQPEVTPTPTPLLILPPLAGQAQPVPAPAPPPVPPAEVGDPRTIPILMYHYIRDVDAGSDPLGYNLSVSPVLFEQHLAWLRDQGYTSLRMDTLAGCLQGAQQCPERAVVLTFDDGYADAYQTAFPLLRQYGFTATFYIISGFVGQPGYMSWGELAALRDAGMEIGAHTIGHYNLNVLDPAEANRQIVQSKTDLERALGVAVLSFCYPAGHYSAPVIEQVRAGGFTSATTTRWDSDTSNMFALPRRRISGGTGVERFAGIVGE